MMCYVVGGGWLLFGAYCVLCEQFDVGWVSICASCCWCPMCIGCFCFLILLYGWCCLLGFFSVVVVPIRIWCC